MKKLFFQLNERIQAENLRVIDQNGQNLGVIPRDEGVSSAREQGLDLVLIASQASPPVAKILDFKKFLYEERQKLKKISRPGRVSGQKELRLTPNIGQGDLRVRIERAREFLMRKHKVKLVIEFRGRAISHPQIGLDKINRVFAELNEVGSVEKEPYWEGKRLMAILKPK